MKPNFLFRSLTFVAFVVIAYTSHAQQAGELDTSFNPNDVGFGSGDGLKGLRVQVIVEQPDGKILIGGDFTSHNGFSRNSIARLNANGTLDLTFNPGSGANDHILSIAVQPDGKILIGGQFTTFNGAGLNRIARLNTDGTVDNTFNTGSGSNGTIRSIVIQPDDGKILIAGDFATFNGTSIDRIARLNSNGSIDPSFLPAAEPDENYIFRTLALQQDGKILAGGNFQNYAGVASSDNITRLNADGSHDNTFIPDAFLTSPVNTILIQTNGKILIGVSTGGIDWQNDYAISRVHENGTLDNTFTAGIGGVGWSTTKSMALQADGKIIIVGGFYHWNGINSNLQYQVARLNTNGTLDNAFTTGLGNLSVHPVTLLTNGKVLVGGNFNQYNGTLSKGIIMLNTNGLVDHTFNANAGSGVNGEEAKVNVILPQPDGKILIGGNFSSFNGNIRNGLACLKTDGTLDTSFDPNNSLGINAQVHSLALQPDGKLLVGGWFANGIIRLNTDGTIDNTFNSEIGASNTSVLTIAMQPNGKILVGGWFLSEGGSEKGIARLNEDGSIDEFFDPTIDPGSGVYSIALQPNGRMVIGGWFLAVNGFDNYSLLRLNPDGSHDETFNAGGSGPDNFIFSVKLKPDGKILIGGWFETFNGLPAAGIARLDENGNLDNTFNSLALDPSSSPAVEAMVIQSDGKIMFSTYNQLIRLHENGTIDNEFNPVSVMYLACLAAQADDKVLIGGSFTSYNGIGRNRIARVYTQSLAVAPEITFNNITKAYGDPSFALAAISNSNGTITYSIVGTDQGTQLTGTYNQTITLGNVGTVTLRATVAPSGNYTLGHAEMVLTITPKNISVLNPSATDKVYDGTPTATITGTLEGVLPQDNEYVGLQLAGTFANNNVGTTKPVTGFALTGSKANNYTLTIPSNITANILPKPVSVNSISALSKVYDGTLAANLSGVLEGVLAQDNEYVSLQPTGTFADKNVGTAKPVTGFALTGTKANNYTLTPPDNITTNILPKPVSITGLTLASKVYDCTALATLTGTPSLVGLLSGDEVTLAGLPMAEYTTINVGTNIPVQVSGYSLSGVDATNYLLEQLMITGVITKQSIAIVANNTHKVFGTPDPAFTYTHSALLNGASINGSLARAAGEEPGSYTISKGDLSAGPNYNIEFVSGKLCINPPKPNVSILEEQRALITSANNGIQWFKDESPIDGAVAKVYVVNRSGLYQVQEIAGTCTSDLSDPIPMVVTHAEQNSFEAAKVYPNPATDFLVLELNTSTANIKISNGQGMLLTPPIQREGNKAIVNLRGLSSGFYGIHISESTNNTFLRIVKE